MSHLRGADADILAVGVCALLLFLAARWSYPLPVLALLVLACAVFAVSAATGGNRGALVRLQELAMILVVAPVGITELVYGDAPRLGVLYGSMTVIAGCQWAASVGNRRRERRSGRPSVRP
ncbi:hypothetical protein GCM10009801_44610 [Streptomyces albiaxialis]|uniref:SPW repeat-containing protein n=1 Tax=Streptomyces albiaxialis TaxID=329523 RepID=A0ABN2W5Y9_9ACTN